MAILLKKQTMCNDKYIGFIFGIGKKIISPSLITPVMAAATSNQLLQLSS